MGSIQDPWYGSLHLHAARSRAQRSFIASYQYISGGSLWTFGPSIFHSPIKSYCINTKVPELLWSCSWVPSAWVLVWNPQRVQWLQTLSPSKIWVCLPLSPDDHSYCSPSQYFHHSPHAKNIQISSPLTNCTKITDLQGYFTKMADFYLEHRLNGQLGCLG